MKIVYKMKTAHKTERTVISGFLRMIFTAVLAFFVCIQSVQTGYAEYSDSDVITGKGGWLFFTGDDTISDYMGTDLLTKTELQELKKRLELFQYQLAQRGCEFVVFIAPNKEQVYAQYMPDLYGAPAYNTRAQQLADYLKDSGFRVVYPIEEMREAVAAHPEYNFYYYGDTHWNNLGAYIGARALLEELGITLPSIEELTIEAYVSDEGDLYTLLGENDEDTGYILGQDGEDIDYILDGYAERKPDMDDLSSDIVARYHNVGGDERKLLVVGDSFSNALAGYLGSAFNEVVVSYDRVNYRPSILMNEQPDVYVYEIVERFVYVMDYDYGLRAE